MESKIGCILLIIVLVAVGQFANIRPVVIIIAVVDIDPF
jgi:hypothetical protein